MSEVQENIEQPVEVPNPQQAQLVKTLLISGGVGALTGLAAGFLFHRRATQGDTELSVTPGDGIKIGLLVLGLLRSVVALADDKDKK